MKTEVNIPGVLNSMQKSLRIFTTDFISSRRIALSEGYLKVFEQLHAKEIRSPVSRKVKNKKSFSHSDFFVFCESGDNK